MCIYKDAPVILNVHVKLQGSICYPFGSINHLKIIELK